MAFRLILKSLLCLSIIPFQVFCQAYILQNDNPIPFRKGNKWGYVNSNKEMVIPFKYDDAGILCDERAWVKKNGTYKYICKNGKAISTKTFSSASDFYNGTANATKGKQYFQIDKNGKVTEATINGYCGTMNARPSFWETFYFENRWGLIHSIIFREKNILKYVTLDSIPPIYDAINIGDGNWFTACKNGFWSLLNCEGNEVIPFKYSACYYHEKGHYAIVKENGKWGIVDTTGKFLIKIKYDEILGFFDSEGNPTNVAKVKIDKKWGFISKSGKEISKIAYYWIEDFKCGLSRVQINDKYGYIDINGIEYFED